MPAETQGTGFLGVGPEEGTFISEDSAYAYAVERCLHGTEEETKEFKEMLVEWYYSGNWIKIEED
ncbi:MAG: hypothetical protein PHV18_15450 [Lachnospiraceae bacterium]|nr:hypothetical protein [Lachnospiraceae bacterium]